MKVEIWFRDELKATLSLNAGGGIDWEGPAQEEAAAVVASLSRLNGKVVGGPLLEMLVKRLRGHWHAVQVSADGADAAA